MITYSHFGISELIDVCSLCRNGSGNGERRKHSIYQSSEIHFTGKSGREILRDTGSEGQEKIQWAFAANPQGLEKSKNENFLAQISMNSILQNTFHRRQISYPDSYWVASTAKYASTFKKWRFNTMKSHPGSTSCW